MRRCIALIVLTILLVLFCSCGSKEPTDSEWQLMRNAILHEYNDYLKTIKGDTVLNYCKNGLTFNLSELGLDYYEMSTSHASFYIPKTEVSSSDYKKYVEQISKQLGEPNCSTAFFAEWHTKDGSYDLSIVYDSEILNCFGIKVGK